MVEEYISIEDLKKAIFSVIYPNAGNRTCMPILTAIESKVIGKSEGVCSDVYQVKLKWSTPTGRTDGLPKSVVVKILTITNIKKINGIKPGDSLDPWIMSYVVKTHNLECDFYDMVMKYDVPLVGCKCYLSRKVQNLERGPPGMLILSDFSETSGNVAVVDGVSLDQTLSVMDGLAKFHAWCIENPHAFQTLFPARSLPTKNRKYVLSNLQELSTRWPEMFPQEQMDIVKHRAGDDFEEELIDVLDKTQDRFNLPTVLGHMDSWTGNLLFEKEEDWTEGGSPRGNLTCILDWQTIQKSCPSADIARFVWSSCQPDDRRQHLDQILRRYHSALSDHLSDKSLLFDYEALADSYDRMSLWAMPSAIAFTAMNILKVKPVPDSDPLKKEKMDRALLRAKYCLEDGLKLYKKLDKQ